MDSLDKSRIINVGSGNSYSVHDIFHIIAKLSDYRKKPIFAESRAGDILHSACDITELERFVDTNSFTNFTEALAETVKWYERER